MLSQSTFKIVRETKEISGFGGAHPSKIFRIAKVIKYDEYLKLGIHHEIVDDSTPISDWEEVK